MTNEEAIEFGNMWLEINEDSKDSNTYEFFQLSIEALKHKALEQKFVLDKIKEDIKDNTYILSMKQPKKRE